jgi:hypothetical protein
MTLGEDQMSQDKVGSVLDEVVRRRIFLSLVEAQDSGKSVDASRKLLEEQFGISEQQVRQIEREGIDNEWPPLVADSAGDGD